MIIPQKKKEMSTLVINETDIKFFFFFLRKETDIKLNQLKV